MVTMKKNYLKISFFISISILIIAATTAQDIKFTRELKPLKPRIYKHGNRESKKVALTIDDGYASNPKNLDLLKSHNIKCTVFIVGKVAKKRVSWIKKMDKMGFEICNHTYSHRWLTSLNEKQIIKEIRKGQEAITKITGKKYPYFRPPARCINLRVLNIIAKEGYKVILWDNDLLGYNKDMSIKRQLAYFRKHKKNGNIILSHFGNQNKSYEMLKIIIPEMIKEGYEFVTITELLKNVEKKKKPVPEYRYFRQFNRCFTLKN